MKWIQLCLIFLFTTACSKDIVVEEFHHKNLYGGYGGLEGFLTLPFLSGAYWSVTQMYETGSHQDWNFSYGDDRFALDFARSGCETYGEAVTPILEGYVKRVEHDDGEDDGYGNSVLIEHDMGYVSRYAHLSQIFVSEGEEVEKTTVLGEVGNTGYTIGSSCGDEAGSHLHLVLYHDGDGVPPEPLSGADLSTGCWYNREGDESCSHDPGEYTPVYDEDDAENHTDLFVRHVEVNPKQGVTDETDFTFVSVVHSPFEKPEVSLNIYNDADGVAYGFEMEAQNHESPYIFTYQKKMRDAQNYSFWVEADQGYLRDSSTDLYFEAYHGDKVPDFSSVTHSPSSGEAGETEFQWLAWAESDRRVEMTLMIVNAQDAQVYRFPMDMETDGDETWSGWYNKVMRDESDYVYWVEASSEEGAQSSAIKRFTVD